MNRKRSTYSTYSLLLCLSILLAGPSACSRKKEDSAGPPPAAKQSEANQPEESSIDPRLAPASDAGAAADPHAGLAGMPNPPGGGAPNPHGDMAGGGGGGGREAEKTADGRVILGPVTAAAPARWQAQPTRSGMRAAQWAIPGKSGDAELVVYYFGPGGAGGVEVNLDRWIKQFEQPDGSASTDKARTEKKTVSGMPVTVVEVTGRYVAAVMPGSPEKNDKPGYMLLGAIVETSAGPYYFKLVGPQATVSAVKKEFRGFIDSVAPAAR